MDIFGSADVAGPTDQNPLITDEAMNDLDPLDFKTLATEEDEEISEKIQRFDEFFDKESFLFETGEKFSTVKQAQETHFS